MSIRLSTILGSDTGSDLDYVVPEKEKAKKMTKTRKEILSSTIYIMIKADILWRQFSSKLLLKETISREL